MALTPEEIKSVNEEYKNLANRLDEIDKKTLSGVKEALLSGKVTLEEWNRELKRFKTTADNIGNSLSYIANSFKDSVNELQKQNKYLSSAKTIINNISKSAQSALSVRRGETDINVKNITLAKQQIASQKEQLKLAIKNGNLTKSQRGEIYKTLNDLDDYEGGLTGVLKTNEEINKSLGFGPQLLGGLDKAFQKLGLPPLGIKDAIDETRRLGQVAAATGDKDFNAFGTFMSKFGENLKNSLSLANVLQASFTAIVKSVLDLNKAQTDFRRLTGESAKEVGLVNDGLLTSVDLIKTQVALTEQFGLNANAAFSSETLQEVGEITKAIGLSSDEAGNLARFSEIAGTNLNGQLDALSKSVPKAFSQKQILSETANVSSDIALAMGNSAYEIGQAVIQAKQLGLSLSDVNGIADSLLDIEQSLAAEFEAEVITGKQLNFERARGFALQNNLAGLTEEIKNNEDLIKGFATANRIEQEAIAKTLNMSRQQMADMVMSSKLVNTLTKEQRANAAGVSVEQLKQLDINQSIDDSINKITQSLAGPLEKFAQLLQYTIQFTDALLVGAGVFALINNRAKIQLGIQNAIAIFQNKNLLKGIADMAINAFNSAAKIPFIGPALGAAAAATAYALGKSYMSKGDDVMSEGGYGNRTLMGPKGSIALNNNDTVIAGTNLFPKDKSIERNAPTNVTVTLSQSDIKSIANAVREGASQATINLDGDKVSNRLQPSLAVNTRRYSV